MKKFFALLFCFVLLGVVGCDWVSPTEPALTAAFTPLYNGTMTVRFTNESRGASGYLWHSGDGQTRVGVFEPQFTYKVEGEYLARLRACPGSNLESDRCKIAEETVTVPK